MRINKILKAVEVSGIRRIYQLGIDKPVHELCDSHDELERENSDLQKKLRDEHFAYKIASNEALQHRQRIADLTAQLAERDKAIAEAGK